MDIESTNTETTGAETTNTGTTNTGIRTGTDTDNLHRQLRRLTDQADIAELLDRHLRSLDDTVPDEEWARTFFTEDVTAEMPIGVVHGRDAVLARIQQGMALFDRTVHLGTNNVIEVDGDRAVSRGAQLSTHVLADGSENVFISGGHADYELVRTEEGWRIRSSSLRIVWTQGVPPQVPDMPEAPAADG